MKNLKRLASLALALTLSLGLCTVAPALAAEETTRPNVYMTFEWSWNVKNDMGKNVNCPQIYLHYTDINGQNGTFNVCLEDGPAQNRLFAGDMVVKKGLCRFNSAAELVYYSDGYKLPYSEELPANIVRINNITFTPRNNSPTFKASNIQIKFNYYYDKDGSGLNYDWKSESKTLKTDNLVLFRTQTYTGTSDFVVKANDKNRQMTLPGFKLQTQEIAEFPGGLPNNLTGSVFGEGSPVLLIVGGAVLVAAFHVVLIGNRKKKEKARAAG